MSIVSLRVFEKQSPRKWTVFREKETLAPACTLAPGVVSDHAGECRCCFGPLRESTALAMASFNGLAA